MRACALTDPYQPAAAAAAVAAAAAAAAAAAPYISLSPTNTH